MDIMELGAIGEMVGGVAVVASLIFVGLQIRANTRTMTADAGTRAQMSWAGINRTISQHRERDTLIRFMDPSGVLYDRAIRRRLSPVLTR